MSRLHRRIESLAAALGATVDDDSCAVCGREHPPLQRFSEVVRWALMDTERRETFCPHGRPDGLLRDAEEPWRRAAAASRIHTKA